jgi:lysozyme family protein
MAKSYFQRDEYPGGSDPDQLDLEIKWMLEDGAVSAEKKKEGDSWVIISEWTVEEGGSPPSGPPAETPGPEAAAKPPVTASPDVVNTHVSDAESGSAFPGLFAGLRRKKPIQGFREAIETWEGKFQADPKDSGNWIRKPDGTRVLVGTMRGVTPAALALHLGVKPWEITVERMKQVTLDEAAQIGIKHYYKGPGFDRLPYVPATEVWVDIGWGSGPVFAIKKMQAMLQVADDGAIGTKTVQAFVDWIRDQGHETTVETIRAWRSAFYISISQPGTKNHKFRPGWLNRANHYRPGTTWWKTWANG